MTLRFAATVMVKMYLDPTCLSAERTIKACMRRLYNVTNVLLGCDVLRPMIRKVKVNSGGASGGGNAFIYVGPELLELTPERVCGLPDSGVELIKPIVAFHKDAAGKEEPDLVEVRVRKVGEKYEVDLTHFTNKT